MAEGRLRVANCCSVRAMAYPEVIRVFATTQDPNVDCPWQAKNPRSSTGSAVVIGKNQVLTGAHVVANATFIQIQKPSHPDKAIARVKAVSHDCDLALLEVIEPAGFLDDIEPAKLGKMPALRDEVAVVGYPVGGEEISITEGVVSRIEVQRYSHSQRNLLSVTVDAAINAGNSGGPVFGDGKVVGIAFQKLNGVDNIGEMVPPPIIAAFLAGVANGKLPGLPALGITTQSMENPFLRSQAKIPNGVTGILVLHVEHQGSSDGVLQSRDVLTHIDGLAIANNGTVQYLGKHRTRFDVVLGDRYQGDALQLGILRNGVAATVNITLGPWRPLVPRSRYDQSPDYFVYGGLVFQTLSRDYLGTWDKWWNKAPKEFLHLYHHGERTEARSEVVVLSQVLADEINLGYGEFFNESIATVNGVMPHNLADLASRLRAATGAVEITTSSGGVMAFDANLVSAASSRILQRYRIVSDSSLPLAAAHL
jgi:S1-C subfamily serine protease